MLLMPLLLEDEKTGNAAEDCHLWSLTVKELFSFISSDGASSTAVTANAI